MFISLYYILFYSLEEVDLLDPASQVDVRALYFVYMPIIQSHVDMFCEAWCNHPLCTAHIQHHILGMAQARIEVPTSKVI